jgi:hypothetical protein
MSRRESLEQSKEKQKVREVLDDVETFGLNRALPVAPPDVTPLI